MLLAGIVFKSQLGGHYLERRRVWWALFGKPHSQQNLNLQHWEVHVRMYDGRLSRNEAYVTIYQLATTAQGEA